MDNSQDINQLTSFLRAEISAVETYDQCLEKIDTAPIKSELETLRASHVRRAQLLTARIRTLGAEPPVSPRPWNGVANLIDGGAQIFSDKAALSALEEGEAQGLVDYQRNLVKLSPPHREFVEVELLPEQETAHANLSRIAQ